MEQVVVLLLLILIEPVACGTSFIAEPLNVTSIWESAVKTTIDGAASSFLAKPVIGTGEVTTTTWVWNCGLGLPAPVNKIAANKPIDHVSQSCYKPIKLVVPGTVTRNSWVLTIPRVETDVDMTFATVYATTILSAKYVPDVPSSTASSAAKCVPDVPAPMASSAAANPAAASSADPVSTPNSSSARPASPGIPNDDRLEVLTMTTTHYVSGAFLAHCSMLPTFVLLLVLAVINL